MKSKIITKEQFKVACSTSNGPGQVIEKLGGCDNGTWRRKIKVFQEQFGIKIPKYDPPRKYKLIEKHIPFIHLYPGSKLGQSMYKYVKHNPDKISQCVYHTDKQTQTLMAVELNNELERLTLL